MVKVYVLALCLLLSGCYTMANLRADNIRNIHRLAIGMNKQEVLDVMGSKYAEKGTLRVSNPYYSESLWGKHKELDVYYYYTGSEKADAIISNDELTPLVFDEGKLTGWGWDFLRDNIKAYKLELRYIQP